MLVFEKKTQRLNVKLLILIKLKSSRTERWNNSRHFYFSRAYESFVIIKVLFQQKLQTFISHLL